MLDSKVLRIPPAFILSQDQTLHVIFFLIIWKFFLQAQDRSVSFLKFLETNIFTSSEHKDRHDVENEIQESIEKILKAVKSRDIESFLTLSLARGIGRTSLSLRKKDFGMLRIDDFGVVKTRYNPIDSTIEEWVERLASDFVQLVGRIGCVSDRKKRSRN